MILLLSNDSSRVCGAIFLGYSMGVPKVMIIIFVTSQVSCLKIVPNNLFICLYIAIKGFM